MLRNLKFKRISFRIQLECTWSWNNQIKKKTASWKPLNWWSFKPKNRFQDEKWSSADDRKNCVCVELSKHVQVVIVVLCPMAIDNLVDLSQHRLHTRKCMFNWLKFLAFLKILFFREEKKFLVSELVPLRPEHIVSPLKQCPPNTMSALS